MCKFVSAQREHCLSCILKGVKLYDSKSNFTSKKYSRVIACFAKRQGISLDAALEFFYHSEVYQLIRDGVSDMHCMSDVYLAEELEQEIKAIIAAVGATSAKDMGKVMGTATKQLAGKADGKAISALVKQLLA